MMVAGSSSRRGLLWAIVGGAVLVVAVIAVLILTLTPRDTPTPPPSPEPSGSTTVPSPSGPSIPDVGESVDPSVAEAGWVPEPITTDPEVYIWAALAAASTFDTTKATRDDWLAYLDSWFTPDTRYTSETDRAEVMADSQLELRQGVVLPTEEWELLAASDGRVAASAAEELATQPVPDDASGDMVIGTGDVVLTFTQSDGSGAEASYEESVRVSVQVLCGAGSVPTPGTAQRAGDCKVVRFFTEPLEP